jgi:DNA-binding HxlR family transcriptional regulator
MLSRADIRLLLSLKDSFKTRGELDAENPVHRDTVSKSLRKLEEAGLILKTPREKEGRYTAEFNLSKKGRRVSTVLESLKIEEMPETGVTEQRWRILSICRSPRRFGEIQRELGIAEPNVDRHLKILVATRLLGKLDEAYLVRPEGRALMELLEV